MKNALVIFGSILTIALILFYAFDDTVTNSYEQYSNAVEDRLFERGWLPKIIPISSSKITTTNNLDINISEGEFTFSSSDFEEFISNLKPFTNRKSPLAKFEIRSQSLKTEGYLPYEYTSGNILWVFFINEAKNHTIYYMWSP